MSETFDAEEWARGYLYPTWEPERAERQVPSFARLLTRAHTAGRREGIKEAMGVVQSDRGTRAVALRSASDLLHWLRALLDTKPSGES